MVVSVGCNASLSDSLISSNFHVNVWNDNTMGIPFSFCMIVYGIRSVSLGGCFDNQAALYGCHHCFQSGRLVPFLSPTFRSSHLSLLLPIAAGVASYISFDISSGSCSQGPPHVLVAFPLMLDRSSVSMFSTHVRISIKF
jgi:hypothetical protein